MCVKAGVCEVHVLLEGNVLEKWVLTEMTTAYQVSITPAYSVAAITVTYILYIYVAYIVSSLCAILRWQVTLNVCCVPPTL